MIHEIWWSLPLTLAVYFAARWLARKLNMPLLNPLLVSMAVIIPLLLLTGIPYERYFQGSKILNDLLQPAVVALAFPLYEQLHQIRARWKSIIAVCFIGSLTAMISGGAIALWLGATPKSPPLSCRNRSLRRSPWPSRTRSAAFRRSARSASFSSVSSAPCSAIRCSTC